MFRASVGLTVLLIVGTGCRQVRVHVDCRLTDDRTQWHLLDGPTYTVLGGHENEEASLAFQEAADMFERALAYERPGLRRVAAGEPSHLVITLASRVVDRGTGISSSPVYGHYPGHAGWYGGPIYHYSSYGVVGTYTETVHLGFAHKLFLNAWIPDATQPAGRRILWEGYADYAGGERSLKTTLPYLMAALVPYYGTSTDDLERVKFDRDDDRVAVLQIRAPPFTQPAD